MASASSPLADTPHTAFGRQRDAEARPHPAADVVDEEALVGREPFLVERW
jgi:hypothetical protein